MMIREEAYSTVRVVGVRRIIPLHRLTRPKHKKWSKKDGMQERKVKLNMSRLSQRCVKSRVPIILSLQRDSVSRIRVHVRACRRTTGIICFSRVQLFFKTYAFFLCSNIPMPPITLHIMYTIRKSDVWSSVTFTSVLSTSNYSDCAM